MTQLLNKAINKAHALSIPEQDILASIILDEIDSEKNWATSFAKSQDLLSSMAAEAITEHAAGKTKPLQRLLMESKTAEKFRALLSTTPQSIQLKAKACYRLWFQNPDHPSLRFKKVHQTLPIYSVRINLNWRSVGAIQ